MRMKVAEIRDIASDDLLASNIARLYQEWKDQRKEWEEQKNELRDYIFATDTTKTSNASLPWKNKTVTPKLCQIRDNLHANYMAAIMATDSWFRWDAATSDSALHEKRKAIEAYIKNKLVASNFYQTLSELVYDYIDTGNCIADVEFVRETHTDSVTGGEIVDYVGPRIVRHSPLEVVFNIHASDFHHTPKITRTITTVGELQWEIENKPSMQYVPETLEKILSRRSRLSGVTSYDLERALGYRIDGFGDLQTYLGSEQIELLEFEGSIRDPNTGAFLKNYLITVADRSHILRAEPIDTWQNISTKHHVGWRIRPGNLIAMGPLDNLVGMQYRIDHLENMKADIFDLIAHPIQKVVGYVEDYEWEPGAKIYVGEDGDFQIISPDTNALNADFQIAALEQKMEEMAGAPKQALGFRTPGEKTAFEVQSLQNAASRIFQHKIAQFEILFLEPLLNTMLEVSRRNMDTVDVIKVIDDDIGVENFMSVTRSDITGRGRLRPIGSRHFAARNQIVQTITQLWNSGLMQDEQVKVHISGKRTAQVLEDLLGLDKFDLVQDNIRVAETMETQGLIQSMQQTAQGPQGPQGQPAPDQQIPPDMMQEDDFV